MNNFHSASSPKKTIHPICYGMMKNWVPSDKMPKVEVDVLNSPGTFSGGELLPNLGCAKIEKDRI